MIPPVLSDLRALAELGSQGVELDFERLRLFGVSPLTDALASHMSFGNMGAETFVLYANGRKQRALGVIQARTRKNRPEADLTFIAPSLDQDPDAVTTWYRLLAEATKGLGELGCQRIYATVPAGNSVEEVFRQAGFSVFTRDQVYLLDVPAVNAFQSAQPAYKSDSTTLRRMRKRDAWNILRLYTAITPRNVQYAEAILVTEGATGKLEDWWENANGTSYVLEHNNTLTGVIRVTRGRLAAWVRLHLAPQAGAFADEVVAAAIGLVSKTRVRPIYVAVRDYEGGIRGALQAAGFAQHTERSHMVKHTTVRVREAVPWLAPVLETSKIPAVHTRVNVTGDR
ncbi:MAG: hypothetical protein HY741_21520 [Chloroflexi bacterium]|nr:hypothetical protein [Chloroflexota bacterium]